MPRRQEKGDIVADRRPLAGLSGSELEQKLVDLGPQLFPSTPDLVIRVRQRLESDPVEKSLTPLPATRSAGTRPVEDKTGGFTPFSPLREEKGWG